MRAKINMFRVELCSGERDVGEAKPIAVDGGEADKDRARRTLPEAGQGRPALEVSIGQGVMSDPKVLPPKHGSKTATNAPG